MALSQPDILPLLSNAHDSAITHERLWVAFTNQTDLWFLKILKRGFRHCFLVVRRDERWIVIDPLANRTELDIYRTEQVGNLIALLEEKGVRLVECQRANPPQGLIVPGIITCVSTLKRYLFLTKPLMLTPYQLYRYLQKNIHSQNQQRR